MAAHHKQIHFSYSQLTSSREHLISFSAHDISPLFAAFAGLSSSPFQLCRTVSFDKLHAVDLGVNRLFCDMSNSFLQRTSRLPFSRIIYTANNRSDKLPRSARLSSHHPFGATTAESQAGISSKIRRQSVPFLWICLMGLSDQPTDSDGLVQNAV